jgi:hypothetical protein
VVTLCDKLLAFFRNAHATDRFGTERSLVRIQSPRPIPHFVRAFVGATSSGVARLAPRNPSQKDVALNKCEGVRDASKLELEASGFKSRPSLRRR